MLATFRNYSYLCSVKTIVRQEVAAPMAAIFVSRLMGKKYRQQPRREVETPPEFSTIDFNSA